MEKETDGMDMTMMIFRLIKMEIVKWVVSINRELNLWLHAFYYELMSIYGKVMSRTCLNFSMNLLIIIKVKWTLIHENEEILL